MRVDCLDAWDYSIKTRFYFRYFRCRFSNSCFVERVELWGCRFFEELARAYQIRNLFEGLNGSRLGVWPAALMAVGGAALVSAVMHSSSGMPAFILFVFISMAFQGLFYLFTGRTALITGYHFAWDFTLATVFGIEALTEKDFTGLFTASFSNLVQMNVNGIQIGNYYPLVVMGLAGMLFQEFAWLRY
jgi:hypothetical protein